MDVASFPYKIGEFVDGEWQGFRHPNRFAREGDRLIVGCSAPFSLLCEWVEQMARPIQLMLVLHSPRGTEAAGRYHSPELEPSQVAQFLHRYRGPFERDARCDLWINSGSLKVGLDKHDLIYVLGSDGAVERDLEVRGFACETPCLPLPHSHHYGEEFDVDFLAMLAEFEWRREPLQPGDDE